MTAEIRHPELVKDQLPEDYRNFLVPKLHKEKTVSRYARNGRWHYRLRLELGRDRRSVRPIGMRWQTWITKYNTAIMLFGVVVLSFCNVVVALGFNFFLGVQKPLPELSAFFLHFHYLVTSLAILWLLAGILAFFFLKSAVRHIYVLVWLQLGISAYAWISTLHFLAR
jgi:hypothetical protein